MGCAQLLTVRGPHPLRASQKDDPNVSHCNVLACTIYINAATIQWEESYYVTGSGFEYGSYAGAEKILETSVDAKAHSEMLDKLAAEL